MIKKCVVIAFAIISMNCSLCAQSMKIERYKGKMVLPSEISEIVNVFDRYRYQDQGGGYYDYYVNKQSERIKHGEFYYISDFIIDFQTDRGLHSISYELKGRFLHGKKNGVWTLREFDRGKKKYTGYTISLTFANDSLNGDFVCGSEKGTIKNGRLSPEKWQHKQIVQLDVNGMPNGVYKTSCTAGAPIEHERYYYHGSLIYIYEFDQSTGESSYSYRISPDVSRPINSNKIKDTVIYGYHLIKYNENYYSVVKASYGTMEVLCWGDYREPSDFCSSILKKLCPTICENWDNTLILFNLDELEKKERQRIQDSIAVEKKRIQDSIAVERKRIQDSIDMAEAIKNRPADSAWAKNREYYALFWSDSISFRETYRQGYDAIQDSINSINREEYGMRVSTVPYLSVYSQSNDIRVNQIFPNYEDYVNVKKQGERYANQQINQLVQFENERIKSEQERALREAEEKAAKKEKRKTIIKACLYYGIPMVALAVWGVATDFKFSGISF